MCGLGVILPRTSECCLLQRSAGGWSWAALLKAAPAPATVTSALPSCSLPYSCTAWTESYCRQPFQYDWEFGDEFSIGELFLPL